MPDNCKAALAAVDGARADDVARQLAKVPDDATHLFVSVGGNDALYEADILQMRVSASAEVFNELSNRASAFEERYKKMLGAVLNLKKPTTLCTIYYPRMEESFTQKIAVAALSSFNDVIIRHGFLSGLPLIDLRFVCSEDADYANAIEPGAKIAITILQVAGEHNFEGNRTSVYF
jgi:class 3 adenylate cyclase